MKDQQARKQIAELEQNLSAFRETIRKDVTIQYCKKCKHPTLQLKDEEDTTATSVDGWTFSFHTRQIPIYQCLTCGTKWIYKTEEVCEEYKK